MWSDDRPWEGPAGDGPDERLLVGETVDEERDQLGEVRDHAAHAALGYGAQRQDPRLLHLPLVVEQGLLHKQSLSAVSYVLVSLLVTGV